MKRVLVSAAVVCIVLVLSACGGKATPDPTAVAQAVAATLTALVPMATPTSTDTPISTSVPVSTALPSATFTPTATPSSPPGWKEYEDIIGLFTVMYPPDWYVEKMREGSVSFVLPKSGYVTVAIGKDPYIETVGMNNERVLNYLIAHLMEPFTPEFDLALDDKGIWKDRGYFIRFTLQKPRSHTVAHVLDITTPLGSDCCAIVMFFRKGKLNEITNKDTNTLGILLSTLRARHLQSVPVPPAPAIELLDWISGDV